MNIQRILRIGLAAFALVLTTSALMIQPPTAAAEGEGLVCCPPFRDIQVKYMGAQQRFANDGEGYDVAFEINNLGQDDVMDITLYAFCDYYDWTTMQFAGADKQPAQTLAMLKNAPPHAILVSCPPKYHQVVTSVTLQAVIKGDQNPANDMAYWDKKSGGHSN